MHEMDKRTPFSHELLALLDKFTREMDLNFNEKVPNLFDFVSQNAVKVWDEQVLLEEDLTAYIAEATELPICTNRNLQPNKASLDKAAALGIPTVVWEHVPILDMGPGMILVHYDPYVPIPACFHTQTVQVVIGTLSTYRRIRDAFNERYTAPDREPFTIPQEPLPQSPSDWAAWQIQYNPMDDQGRGILEEIRQTDSFEKAPLEWEYWYQNKLKKQNCVSLSILEPQPDSKLVSPLTLKSIEAAILFESSRLMQLGHVLNWSNYNSVEAVVEQCGREGKIVQVMTLVAQDYAKYLEDQINRQINLSAYISKDDIADEIAVDEIDPNQFTEEQPLDKDDSRIKTMAELIIFSAYKRGASDILIEPQANDYRVRFTIDGINTVFHAAIPKNYGSSIVAHLKVRASMNITERRLPQDGKITLQIKGKPVEMRAATMPVAGSGREDHPSTAERDRHFPQSGQDRHAARAPPAHPQGPHHGQRHHHCHRAHRFGQNHHAVRRHPGAGPRTP